MVKNNIYISGLKENKASIVNSNFNKTILFIAIFASIFQYNTFSQQKEVMFWYGGYGAYNINLHFAAFQSLPGIEDCCPEYRDGSGYGFSIGGLFEYPLRDDLGFNVRLGYSSMNGDLKEKENIGFQTVRDVKTDQTRIATVYVNDVINSRIQAIALETTLSFNFFHSMYMDAGFQYSYIIAGNVDHYEQLIEPDNVVFFDGRLVQNDVSDVEIQDRKNLLISGIFGIGYQVPIGEQTVLVPEIRYYMPFMDVTTVDWKIASLHVGASFKIPVLEPFRLPEMEETIYKRDTSIIAIIGLDKEEFRLISEKVERYKDTTVDRIINYTKITEHYEKKIPKEGRLEVVFELIGLAKDGTRQMKPTVVIEELETEEGFPLLPHIYFPEGSSDLSISGLKLDTKDSIHRGVEVIKNLPWNTLGIYDELLNIIAERMKLNPEAKLTITGCNSNKGIEANNLDLSERRAEAIKGYLVSVWGIDAGRLSVQKRNLPDNPGNIAFPEGLAENQRAELSSTDNELLKPVSLKEIVKSSNPPYILIKPKITADAGISNWRLIIQQGEQILRDLSGTSIEEEIRWTVEEEPIPSLDDKINIILEARDNTGKVDSFQDSLALEQLTIKKKRYELKGDRRIERFSLILFDYDKADVSLAQLDILNSIKSRIKDNSIVTIAGYADRTGETGYNKELANRRIQEVQKILKVPRWNLKTKPVGSDVLLYDNNLPQGRGYSRTVQITIETPVD